MAARIFGRGNARGGEIVLDSFPDVGQGRGEMRHAFVLGFVTHFTPTGVIAALLSAPASRPVT